VFSVRDSLVMINDLFPLNSRWGLCNRASPHIHFLNPWLHLVQHHHSSLQLGGGVASFEVGSLLVSSFLGLSNALSALHFMFFWRWVSSGT
jgi:hypothetical protein